MFEKSHLSSILLRPRRAVREFGVPHQSTSSIIIYSLLFGELAVIKIAIDPAGSAQWLLVALVVCPVIAFFGLTVIARLMCWITKLLGGVGDYPDVQLAGIWSQYPLFVVVPFELFMKFVFKIAHSDPVRAGDILHWIGILSGLWGTIIWIEVVSETHKISAGRTLLAQFIIGIIFVAAGALVAVCVLNFMPTKFSH